MEEILKQENDFLDLEAGKRIDNIIKNLNTLIKDEFLPDSCLALTVMLSHVYFRMQLTDEHLKCLVDKIPNIILVTVNEIKKQED
jgi:thiamine pyrophosphokinase